MLKYAEMGTGSMGGGRLLSGAYPIFINEAADYEKGNAMILTQKQKFELSNFLE